MSDDLRPIPRIPAPDALKYGGGDWPCEFVMQPISEMRIRKTYQRDLTKASARNALNIAKEFDWAKFGCLIIRPVKDGLFEVIDGQHRATAALLAGIQVVPAIIVQADAADTFLGVNRTRTSLTPLAIFNAERAAGEPDATRIALAASKAGVIIRRNTTSGDLPPGELVAIIAVRAVLKKHGLKVLRTVFRGLRRSEADATPLTPSALTATNMRAAAFILKEYPAAQGISEDGAAEIIAAMFRNFDLRTNQDLIDLERLETGASAYVAQARVMMRQVAA